MKCQHCNQNEATFYYRSTVNGRTTQTRLCAECAEKLGYTAAMRPMRAFESAFFPRPFSLLEGFGSRLLTEFPSPVEEVQEKEEALLDDTARDEFTLQCRRNALEHRLQTAIAEENYEEAARVRDELRTLSA